MNANSAVVLDDDEKMIKKHFSIWSGEEVIIERVNNEEDENEDEYEDEANEVLKNRVSINDVLKDSSINQFFFGGITVIGLYVVFQLIKKSK